MASTITDNLQENCGVLLLGANGRLGQMLRRAWPGPAPLVAQSRQALRGFIQFDLILEPERAQQEMTQKRAVICLSGVTPARVAAQGDVFSRNTDLALAAVRAAAHAGVPRLFLASSAAVYGAATGVQTEDATPRPVAPYGVAKLEMEQAALTSAKELGQAVTILRIGNVAGADAILGGWREGMQIDQLSDGTTPQRSYIGPQTLARVIARLCQAEDLPQILNIAAPGTIEMGALLDAAALPWAPRTASQNVIPKVALCTKRLEAHARFAPEDSTAAGMVAEWRRDQAQE